MFVRLLAFALSVLMLLGIAVASPQIIITGEIGPEFDSNARRLAQDEQPQGSALLRATAQATVQAQLSSDHRATLSYGAGGKLFFSETDATEFVQRAFSEWRIFFDNDTLGQSNLAFQGYYYDAFQNRSERDFRIGRGGLRFTSHPFGQRVSILVGFDYQTLVFKPAPELDFNGPRGLLRLGWNFGITPNNTLAAWSASVSYVPTLRVYDDSALGPPGATSSFRLDNRQDTNQLARFQIDYADEALGSIWYSADFNTSNSYGESYTRHVVGLRMTLPLPSDFYLTAQGVIQLSKFSDELFGRLPNQTLVDIDNENRSNMMLYLSRDLTETIAISFRYSVFFNESATAAGGLRVPGFRRHTLFTGLRILWES